MKKRHPKKLRGSKRLSMKRGTPKNAKGSKRSLTKKRYLNNHTFVKPKIKQGHQVIEGTISSNRMVKGEGDAFQFDDCRAQILVPH
jgi:hypothetical protein